MLAAQQTSLLNHWRRCVGRRQQEGRRRLGVIGYLVDGPVVDGLIELERLTLVVLYDEPLAQGHVASRLAGFSGTRVPWGVMWGGPEQSPFFKDLSLQPVPQARGLRLDLCRGKLLQLGLQLDRELDRHARHPSLPRRHHLNLPRLWAGFTSGNAVNIAGDGPELEAYAHRTARTAGQLLSDIRREHCGLSLYPLAWVSHHWRQMATVFADLARFPKRQVFRLHHLPADLIGYQDAAHFDFFHTRFRKTTRCGHRTVGT
jgi:hypothetical protein